MRWLIVLWLLPLAALADVRIAGGTADANSANPFGDTPAVEAALDFGAHRQWEVAAGWIGDQRDTVEEFGYVSAQRMFRFTSDDGNGALVLGLGLMAREHTENIDLLLPQWWNFSISAGIEWGPIGLTYRHASNAGLESPNRGQNWLLASWRF